MKNRLLPFISWMRDYNKKNFISDGIAGILLAIILLPKSMAYAVIAGLPPVYGIYTNLFSPAVGSLWGSSRLLSTGAAAVISFLVFTSVGSLATPLTPEFISIAILLAFLVGIIQLLLGFFKLGSIMSFISHSVIKGFTNAAAIIIIFSQLKDILGIKVAQSDSLIHTIIGIFEKISHINIWTLGIGVISMGFILLSKKIHKLFPGALIVVIIFTFLTGYYSLDSLHHISIIGKIPSGLPMPGIPPIGFDTIISLLPMSLIIAIIGFTEAYSVSKMMAAKTKEKVDVNQELIGQGFANLITGLFKGFPVSGSFSGTAVNYSAGAKTGLSNVVASIIMILFLLFFTQYLYFLPKAVLAAIVIVAVSSLVNFGELIQIAKLNKNDGIIAFSTFVLALLMKPDYAIFLGVLFSLMVFLYKTARPKITVLGTSNDLTKFVDSHEYKVDICPQILLIRPEMSLYFANIENIFERTQDIINKSKKLKYLLIESTSINNIDATAMHELIEFLEDVEKKGIHIYFVNLKSALVKTFENNGMADIIGKGKFVIGKNELLTSLFCSIDKDYCKNKCGKNAFRECQSFK